MTAPNPQGPKCRNVTRRTARIFERDLDALIRRAQDGKDLQWVPVCLWLLEARKELAPMLNVKEMA